MAYLTPPGTHTPYGGDSQYWQGYELIESDVDLGPTAHQLIIQTRLNEFQAAPEAVHIFQIQTRVYVDTANPSTGDRYLTTINFSVIGDPNTYPVIP
jgi:hypothetical protein